MKTRSALLLAGSLIALTLAVTFADKAGYIGDDTSKRIIQVAIGLLVVYFANLAPKTLEPLSATCEPARLQSLQRFTGWALVLGGLGYSLAWLVLPIERAGIWSMALLGTGLLAAAGRSIWTINASRRQRPGE